MSSTRWQEIHPVKNLVSELSILPLSAQVYLRKRLVRYIAVTSDLKRVSNRRVRIHHHVIANPEAWKVIKKKWDKKWGRPHTKRLRKEKDYLSVAIYFLKQVRHDIPHQHRYISSRNLIRPQPIDYIAYSGMVLNTPKDCELLSSTALIPGMPQYARYLMPSDP